jgi:hypothetical protein
MCIFLRSGFRLATSSIMHRLVKCCRLLSFWKVLPSQPRNSIFLSEWSLGIGHLPDQGPSCPVALTVALGRVRVVPYFFSFPIIETTVHLETFNTLEMFLFCSSDAVYASLQLYIRELQPVP